jgi:hypothetical protein
LLLHTLKLQPSLVGLEAASAAPARRARLSGQAAAQRQTGARGRRRDDGGRRRQWADGGLHDFRLQGAHSWGRARPQRSLREGGPASGLHARCIGASPAHGRARARPRKARRRSHPTGSPRPSHTLRSSTAARARPTTGQRARSRTPTKRCGWWVGVGTVAGPLVGGAARRPAQGCAGAQDLSGSCRCRGMRPAWLLAAEKAARRTPAAECAPSPALFTHCCAPPLTPLPLPRRQARRRDPRVYDYLPDLCQTRARKLDCVYADACPYAHNVYGGPPRRAAAGVGWGSPV